jgi:hypothetical protein
LLFASLVSSGHHRFDVFGKQTDRLCVDGQGNGERCAAGATFHRADRGCGVSRLTVA